MKLCRFGEKGRERPGIWMGDGRILDVRAVAFHIEDYNEFFFANHGIAQLQTLHPRSGREIHRGGRGSLGPTDRAALKDHLRRRELCRPREGVRP